MTDSEFRSMLAGAIAGNEDDLAGLFAMYMPLINRHSCINGHLDEDLRQCILIEIFKSLGNFKIFPKDD